MSVLTGDTRDWPPSRKEVTTGVSPRTCVSERRRPDKRYERGPGRCLSLSGELLLGRVTVRD